MSPNELFFYWEVSRNERSFLFAYVLDDYFCRGCLKNTSDTFMGGGRLAFYDICKVGAQFMIVDVASDQPLGLLLRDDISKKKKMRSNNNTPGLRKLRSSTSSSSSSDLILCFILHLSLLISFTCWVCMLLFEIQSVMIESEYRRSRNERFSLMKFEKKFSTKCFFVRCLSISRSNSRDLEWKPFFLYAALLPSV